MNKLTQMRFVTENYEVLQGLRMIPFGLWFLAMAWGEFTDIVFLQQGRLDYSFILLLAVGGLYWLIGQYYARSYGQVTQLRRSLGQKIMSAWPLLLFVAGIVIDVWLMLPVSFLAITLSIYFFVPFIQALPLVRLHYALVGLVLLLLSLMPLFVGPSLKMQFFAPTGAYFLLGLGLALVVAGILDHLWLRNMMQPQQGAV